MHAEENRSRLIALGYELGYGGREEERWRGGLYKHVSMGRSTGIDHGESYMLH